MLIDQQNWSNSLIKGCSLPKIFHTHGTQVQACHWTRCQGCHSNWGVHKHHTHHFQLTQFVWYWWLRPHHRPCPNHQHIQDTSPMCSYQLNHIWHCLSWLHLGPNAPCNPHTHQRRTNTQTPQDSWIGTSHQPHGHSLPLGTWKRTPWPPPGPCPLLSMQRSCIQYTGGSSPWVSRQCPRHCFCLPTSMCHQPHQTKGMEHLHCCSNHHTQSICGGHWQLILRPPQWPHRRTQCNPPPRSCCTHPNHLCNHFATGYQQQHDQV